MSKLTSFPKYLGNKNHKFQKRLCKGESSARFMVFAQIVGTPEGGGDGGYPITTGPPKFLKVAQHLLRCTFSTLIKGITYILHLALPTKGSYLCL